MVFHGLHVNFAVIDAQCTYLIIGILFFQTLAQKLFFSVSLLIKKCFSLAHFSEQIYRSKMHIKAFFDANDTAFRLETFQTPKTAECRWETVGVGNCVSFVYFPCF